MTNTNIPEANRDAILDKIKKILDLHARPGTPEEGQTALKQARRLMEKYKVADDEVRNRNEKPVVVVAFRYGRKMPEWVSGLADLIAGRFRCVSYVFQPYAKPRTTEIRFFGFKTDARAAFLAFAYGVGAGRTLWERTRRFYKAMDLKAGMEEARAYYYGYVLGIKVAFEEQDKSEALIVLAPGLILREFEKMHGGKEQKDMEKPDDPRFIRAGYYDGLAFEKNKRALKEGDGEHGKEQRRLSSGV